MWRQPNRIPTISWQHRQLLINLWRGFRSEKRLLLDLPQLSVHLESADCIVVSMFAQSVAVHRFYITSHGQTSPTFKTQANLELFYKQLVVFLGSFFFLFINIQFSDQLF